MRLLRSSNLTFVDFVDSKIPKFAILSHTWGSKEMSYQEFRDLPSDENFTQSLLDNADRLEVVSKLLKTYANIDGIPEGLMKIVRFGQLARRDGIEYIWVDTCCINKESSAELSEAINSMYNWYRQAQVCWVFLSDVIYYPSRPNKTNANKASSTKPENGSQNAASSVQSPKSGFMVESSAHKSPNLSSIDQFSLGSPKSQAENQGDHLEDITTTKGKMKEKDKPSGSRDSYLVANDSSDKDEINSKESEVRASMAISRKAVNGNSRKSAQTTALSNEEDDAEDKHVKPAHDSVDTDEEEDDDEGSHKGTGEEDDDDDEGSHKGTGEEDNGMDDSMLSPGSHPDGFTSATSGPLKIYPKHIPMSGNIDSTNAQEIVESSDPYYSAHGINDETVQSLKASRWFTRGWALQELIAPVEVRFFDKDWTYFGTKYELATEISEITGIDVMILLSSNPADLLSECTVAERMSWAAKRQTTRIEDIAYSLLGIFGVHMSLLYGEGDNAFIRLQKKILKLAYDETIFAWDPEHADSTREFHGLLAPHPRAFIKSKDIMPLNIEDDPVSITSRGASFFVHNQGYIRTHSSRILLPLNCRRDDEIVGIALARFRGAWYRVSKLMRHNSVLHELGGHAKDPVLKFDNPLREAIYVSITPTVSNAQDHLVAMQTTAPCIGIRFSTHMIPWKMIMSSVDNDTATKLKEAAPEVAEFESKQELLPVEMTDTGKDVYWAPPLVDITEDYEPEMDNNETMWHWSPIIMVNLDVRGIYSRSRRSRRRSEGDVNVKDRKYLKNEDPHDLLGRWMATFTSGPDWPKAVIPIEPAGTEGEVFELHGESALYRPKSNPLSYKPRRRISGSDVQWEPRNNTEKIHGLTGFLKKLGGRR